MNDQDSVRLPKKWDDDDEARALMETALEPVSYTHLDVYKRQAPMS